MLYPGRKKRLASVELNKLGKEAYNRHAKAQTLSACSRADSPLKCGVSGAAWSFGGGRGGQSWRHARSAPWSPSRAGEGDVGHEETDVPLVSCVTRCFCLPSSEVAFLFCL